MFYTTPGQPGRYAASVTSKTHSAEPHVGAINTKLNWLRAGVLGANDGIVSVAGIVIGVAAATMPPMSTRMLLLLSLGLGLLILVAFALQVVIAR